MTIWQLPVDIDSEQAEQAKDKGKVFFVKVNYVK